jgi:hypothetical protein
MPIDACEKRPANADTVLHRKSQDIAALACLVNVQTA